MTTTNTEKKLIEEILFWARYIDAHGVKIKFVPDGKEAQEDDVQ